MLEILKSRMMPATFCTLSSGLQVATLRRQYLLMGWKRIFSSDI
jgi:hypothetical protein